MYSRLTSNSQRLACLPVQGLKAHATVPSLQESCIDRAFYKISSPHHTFSPGHTFTIETFPSQDVYFCFFSQGLPGFPQESMMDCWQCPRTAWCSSTGRWPWEAPCTLGQMLPVSLWCPATHHSSGGIPASQPEWKFLHETFLCYFWFSLQKTLSLTAELLSIA